MKKIVTIISNDWHIQPDNTDIVRGVILQKIQLAVKNGVSEIYALGDIFQSRQKQPLSVLKCFENILDDCLENGVTMHVIPGNHDKTDYSSEHSFLDPFSYHPAIKLYTSAETVLAKGVNFHLIPFFNNDVWIDQLKSLNIKGGSKNILLSHIALNGSVNNDGTKVESSISFKDLSYFDYVYLSHYHNYHPITESIHHLPSIRQSNFGEDNSKGFTLIYEDGSFDIHKSKSREYKTVTINVDKLNKKEFNKLVEEHKPTDDKYIRLKIVGTEENVKTIKTEELKSLGYSVKLEQSEITNSIESAKLGEVIEFTDSSIFEEFNKFCETEGYDGVEDGIKYLKKVLK